MFQVRVGNGKSWSAWSHTSKAFTFQVPPPIPPREAAQRGRGPARPVSVEVVSSTAARLRWGDFRPAQGLQLLEYEVKGTPTSASQSSQASAPVSLSFEHKYRGGFIEHEISNLLPFTPYIFSVQARYPRIGMRTWSGTQESESIILEQAAAFQDPPTPAPVPESDIAEDDIESSEGVCSALLEFPREEEGCHYDLEYAHILGEETDTAEMRTSQSIWHTPSQVTLIDSGAMGDGASQRWRIRLPDIKGFRAEALKLALLQRVVFRLRARITPESSTSRWWSSLSAPIATGFATPESCSASLVAHGDRLAIEVQFSLDKRLSEAAAAAGPVELKAQRTELFKALQQQQQPKSSQAIAAAATASMRTSGQGQSQGQGQAASWPRGFGHSLVTRYQLRMRSKREDGNWSDWDVHPDCGLPQEVDKHRTAGFTRRTNPSVAWYEAEAPQPKGRGLLLGESVQISCRLGDGVKWSAWRAAKEIQVALGLPKCAREGDAASASWVGRSCTLSWPPVAAHSGIDFVEYQLMVIPDSSALLPYVGGVIIGPASNLLSKGEGEMDLASTALIREGVRKNTRIIAGQAKLVGEMAAQPTQTQMRLSPEHGDSGQLSPGRRASSNSASPRSSSMNVQAAMSPGEKTSLISLELSDLCPDLRYSFAVLARYPTIGQRNFSKIFEVPLVSRVSGLGAVKAGGAQNKAVAADLTPPPTPIQVPFPESGNTKLSQWLQEGSGRLVLLTYPELTAEGECPREATKNPSVSDFRTGSRTYEVQATEYKPDYVADGGEDRREWHPCPVSGTPFLADGVPCIAIRALPFMVGQFRFFDAQIFRAGPPTLPLVTVYEEVFPAPSVEMTALGKGAPRTLGVRLHISRSAPGGTQSRASLYQVRFRPVGVEKGKPEQGERWEELDPQILPSAVNPRMASSGSAAGSRPLTGRSGSKNLANQLDPAEVIVREEDGLELGPVYEFQARLGDSCRLGPWSSSSKPLRFSVSPPMSITGGGLRTSVQNDSADFSWNAFGPQTRLAERMPGFKELPIEYTINVVGGTHKEPVSSLVTRETHIRVGGLKPNTAYSVTLKARWARFGVTGHEEDEKGEMLMAAFVTSGSGGRQLVAELSVRVPSETVGGYGPAKSVQARLPMTADGAEPVEVTLGLDPYFVPPRLQHYTPDFVRKPTLPSSRNGQGAAPPPEEAQSQQPEVQMEKDGDAEGGRNINSDATDILGTPLLSKSKLPAIVPMPPPKFTTRDPITFALFPVPAATKPTTPRPSQVPPRRPLPSQR
eukprot:TRINITY_DN22723_c0_g1_i1.p1 TRINITY_DN22723_c0_g1~~TRINITY_DN22723_c0_g1_i1.p1  ORF type:complete len:1273 (+),score=214.74 TRINITY_DN22723_c0_g1_i1:224-4042(+)